MFVQKTKLEETRRRQVLPEFAPLLHVEGDLVYLQDRAQVPSMPRNGFSLYSIDLQAWTKTP